MPPPIINGGGIKTHGLVGTKTGGWVGQPKEKYKTNGLVGA